MPANAANFAAASRASWPWLVGAGVLDVDTAGVTRVNADGVVAAVSGVLSK